MPKCDEHKVIGTAMGAITAVGYGYYVEQDFAKSWQYALGGVLGGYMTARLADILEPSKILGPNHRGIFHGIALNGGLAALLYRKNNEWLQTLVDKANEYDSRQEHLKAFILRVSVGLIIGGIGGHASHLLADLTTSKGLPLMGRL